MVAVRTASSEKGKCWVRKVHWGEGGGREGSVMAGEQMEGSRGRKGVQQVPA